ncbi:FAD/NAD(P)-binding protein [Legionella tunisiensis]|uniref:FAD/NAD(P)-binding protein n=1 Tax=Legionella tunisiensis TaxID=1034944 RepID=UPI000A07575E|nr:FAD/NAD(P)-binding protein [Legionella tunisiensis]
MGHGLPYDAVEDDYILNLPKATMEPLPGQSNQFATWLSEKFPETNSTSFPPRHYFGQYLEEMAIRTQLEAESEGLTINYLTDNEVTDIVEEKEGVFHITAARGNYHVNKVILAPGHMPSTAFSELIGKKGYIHNPWERGAFKHLPLDEPVTIIGSRLTAIDVALKLKHMNPNCKLTMVSRSGLLPTVLGKEMLPHTLNHLTLEAICERSDFGQQPLSLDEIGLLFWKEIDAIKGRLGHLGAFPKSAKDISAIDWITNEINEAEQGSRAWQEVLFALYPLTPDIWPMIRREDQERFIKAHYSLFITYLAAFPLENAHKIKAMLASGQLKVQGGLSDISSEADHFIVRFENGEHFTSNTVINATGPGYDASKLPFLTNLFRQGYLVKNPLGGIQVDKDTLHIINAMGNNNPHFYAIGELTKGIYFLTTDFGRVTVQAEKIVKTLIQQTVNSSVIKNASVDES